MDYLIYATYNNRFFVLDNVTTSHSAFSLSRTRPQETGSRTTGRRVYEDGPNQISGADKTQLSTKNNKYMQAY
jgi:hypothetical protein